MPYDKDPQTDFQRYIRQSKEGEHYAFCKCPGTGNFLAKRVAWYFSAKRKLNFVWSAEMMGSSLGSKPLNQLLHDHRSLELNTDDYDRVCQIPKRKVGFSTSQVWVVTCSILPQLNHFSPFLLLKGSKL